MINLKNIISEKTPDIDPVEYFNNGKFRLNKTFPKYYLKKYGKDARYEPNDWPGKVVKIYKVKPGDTSVEISWPAQYKTLGGSSPRWTIFVPFKDVFKYNLFIKEKHFK